MTDDDLNQDPSADPSTVSPQVDANDLEGIKNNGSRNSDIKMKSIKGEDLDSGPESTIRPSEVPLLSPNEAGGTPVAQTAALEEPDKT